MTLFSKSFKEYMEKQCEVFESFFYGQIQPNIIGLVCLFSAILNPLNEKLAVGSYKLFLNFIWKFIISYVNLMKPNLRQLEKEKQIFIYFAANGLKLMTILSNSLIEDFPENEKTKLIKVFNRYFAPIKRQLTSLGELNLESNIFNINEQIFSRSDEQNGDEPYERTSSNDFENGIANFYKSCHSRIEYFSGDFQMKSINFSNIRKFSSLLAF